jgi:hypothetical protein
MLMLFLYFPCFSVTVEYTCLQLLSNPSTGSLFLLSTVAQYEERYGYLVALGTGSSRG